MSKIKTTAEGTKFDPMNQVEADLKRLGLSLTRETAEFSLTSQGENLNPFSDIDIGEFRPDSSLFADDAQALPLLEEATTL